MIVENSESPLWLPANQRQDIDQQNNELARGWFWQDKLFEGRNAADL